MPTIKQIKAVDALVGNGGNVTKAMRVAKYSENTINTPQKLTESIGFKEIMEEYGLTEGLVTRALVEDIKKKPQRRIKELELGANILGMTDREERGGNKTLIINITGESAQRYGIIASQDTEGSSS